MNSPFWTNTIWYILLGILTLIELAYVILRAKQKRFILVYYFTLVGIAFSLETIMLIFLKAYTYYPMILKHPPTPFDDVLAGNVFSQFSIAATALLFVFLNLKFFWAVIFAGIYAGIEEIFLTLGIYSHYWYRTWFTLIGFPVFFWLAKKIYLNLQKGTKKLFYYGYIMLALFPMWIIFYAWGLLTLLRIQNTSTSIMINPIYSRYTISLILFGIVSIPIMLMHYFEVKKGWKTWVILLIYTLYYFGYLHNLILIKEGWFLAVSTTSIFWMYFSVFILDKYYRTAAKVL